MGLARATAFGETLVDFSALKGTRSALELADLSALWLKTLSTLKLVALTALKLGTLSALKLVVPTALKLGNLSPLKLGVLVRR